MSAERINQINTEFIEILITLKEACARAVPLAQELEDLGVKLPPETRKMFLSLSKMK